MRSIFLAVLLLLAVPLHASQQVMQPTDAYFAVIVDDVDAAASWYAHAFGLEELSRLSEEGSYDILNLGNDTLLVDLLWLADGAERPARHTHGFFKAGFFVADLAAFKASLPEDVALSNELADEKHGLLGLQIEDPEGNVIQVMQRLPEDQPGAR